MKKIFIEICENKLLWKLNYNAVTRTRLATLHSHCRFTLSVVSDTFTEHTLVKFEITSATHDTVI